VWSPAPDHTEDIVDDAEGRVVRGGQPSGTYPDLRASGRISLVAAPALPDEVPGMTSRRSMEGGEVA
jgi:hypothetical protein